MLPASFLDELRAATPMQGLVGRRVRLTRSGRNWKGCCPFHNEKSPSFYVYDDSFHCFGCGAHGDALSFVMQSEGATFMEAVERLAGEAGMQVPKASPEAAARAKEAASLYDVLNAVQAAYQRRLALPEGGEARAYLARRGLTPEAIARIGIGWSGAGRGAIFHDLAEQGITKAQLVAAGIMQERDDGPVDLFFNRVMFPIRDKRGRIIAYGGRILGDGQPKYVNSPETAIFRKRLTLYGIDVARDAAFKGAPVIATEGYMDVIALEEAGFLGAVAPLGTALTQEQMQLLWQMHPAPVLCFDGDAAGAKAAAKAIDVALPLIEPGQRLMIATLPNGMDPDDLIKAQGADGMKAALAAARPLHAVLFDVCRAEVPPTGPEGRAALKQRLKQAVMVVRDRDLRLEYQQALMERFNALPRAGRASYSQVRFVRPPLRPTEARLTLLRALLTLVDAHPFLLEVMSVEEISQIDMPPRVSALRDALLAQGHLTPEQRQALLSADLPAECAPGSDPFAAEAVARELMRRLLTEGQLEADIQAARDALAAGEVHAQARLAALTQELAMVRARDEGLADEPCV